MTTEFTQTGLRALTMRTGTGALNEFNLFNFQSTHRFSVAMVCIAEASEYVLKLIVFLAEF
jgi:hypothetical protein